MSGEAKHGATLSKTNHKFFPGDSFIDCSIGAKRTIERNSFDGWGRDDTRLETRDRSLQSSLPYGRSNSNTSAWSCAVTVNSVSLLTAAPSPAERAVSLSVMVPCATCTQA